MALGTDIPVKIVEQIVPVVSKQLDQISTIAQENLKKVFNLPDDVTCDDPRVIEIKKNLQNLQRSIQNIQTTVAKLPGIISIFQQIANLAGVLILIPLAAPTAPGQPVGPNVEAINKLSALIRNVVSAAACLTGLLSSVKNQLKRVNSTLMLLINKLGSICYSETFEVSPDVDNLMKKAQRDELYNQQYPSEFYRTVNVSDYDIEYRFRIIDELLQQQLDVMTNLFEAPSTVYRQSGTPSVEVGDINDYYINTDTNSIYGPKTLDGWGQPINL